MTLADGCFDPAHCGHLDYLIAAAALGRPLVVNIAPDSAIYAKGRRPYQTREERARFIFALDCVDRVICQDLAEAIRTLKPTVLAKGPDWRGRLPVDVFVACQDTGTEIHYTDTQAKTSRERLSA